MSDDETIRLYDEKARDYAALTNTDAPDATLSAFMALLPRGAHVLDLGCGPGSASRHFAAHGFSVDATDAAQGMVDLAGAIDGVTAWQAQFDDLDGDAAYDGIWANFSLLHAPRADLPRHLAAIRKALKPGGVFHIAVKEGTGSKRDRLGRLYTYYTEPELTVLLQQAGFKPGVFQHGEDMGFEGSLARWISVTAHG